MGRAERITDIVQEHDSKLYCARSPSGVLSIFRKSHRFEHFEVDGVHLTHVRPAPHYIFALTDNWKPDGNPVDWGAEPILARLKAMDLWHRDLLSEQIERAEREEESKRRELSNRNEAFAKEHRRFFAKVFDDVNTANMDVKNDLRRYHNGSY